MKRLLSTYSKNPISQFVLEKVAKAEGFQEVAINHDTQSFTDEGFSSNVTFVNLFDKKSNKKLDLVIKEATDVPERREHYPVEEVFNNEYQFYKTVWPKLHSLQTNHLKRVVFDNVPKWYDTVGEVKDCLIFENLRSRKFKTIDKQGFFNKHHIEYILKKFGQFHGLSYAYKHHKNDEFQGFTQALTPCWPRSLNSVLFQNHIKDAIENAAERLELSNDKKLIQKFLPYLNDGIPMLQNSLEYNGKHGAILHGDCWSSNMMFSYDMSGNITDMKLIDFQLANLGSVVYDLSYFLYSGGTKDVLDNLDSYLRVYHDSLSVTCNLFSCKNHISFHELKQEWKDNSKFGFIMSLLLLHAKLVKWKDVSQQQIRPIEETYETKTLQLIEHMDKHQLL